MKTFDYHYIIKTHTHTHIITSYDYLRHMKYTALIDVSVIKRYKNNLLRTYKRHRV